ncbi:hypothetical protein HMPREF1548_02837 [Clostridium sp. KLE 1755]|nr:hypothetical protein HMPREF1548_02837 [Clostridium sp. KLE 1755]
MNACRTGCKNSAGRKEPVILCGSSGFLFLHMNSDTADIRKGEVL